MIGRVTLANYGDTWVGTIRLTQQSLFPPKIVVKGDDSAKVRREIRGLLVQIEEAERTRPDGQ